jgi:DNA-binding LacI/PurR family transcriptional regulator
MDLPDPIDPEAKQRRGRRRWQPATLADVARLAGVCKGTVSSVLNGSRSNTRVSEATRERILAAVAELDYHPSWAGRALRQKQSNVIGYYGSEQMAAVHGLVAAEITVGLHEGCRKHGVDLLLHGAFRGRGSDDICGGILDGKTDGLVLWTSAHDPLIQEISLSRFPAVLVADAAPRLPSVVVDDSGGPRLLAAHLEERGHRRVLYRVAYQDQAGAHRRLRAFVKAAAERRMKVEVHTGSTGWFSDEEKAALGRRGAARPTAVVCWCDAWVRSAVSECLSMGWSVPGDVAVVGFDGLSGLAEETEVPTTIYTPWRNLGHTAVSMLVATISGESVPRKTVVPVVLAVGATS